MARIKSVSQGKEGSWKIEIDDSVPFQFGITDIHEGGAKIEVRVGDANGNIEATLTDKTRHTKRFNSFAVFIRCYAHGRASDRVTGNVTGDGGSAAVSFKAASFTVGAA